MVQGLREGHFSAGIDGSNLVVAAAAAAAAAAAVAAATLVAALDLERAWLD